MLGRLRDAPGVRRKRASPLGQPRVSREHPPGQGCATRGAPFCCRQSAVHGQAAQNREALAERGAKLQGLGERTERMEADAMDFASMARQIAARERDRKWWQM